MGTPGAAMGSAAQTGRPTARAAWTYSPRGPPGRAREEGNYLRRGVEAALAAGHGAGVGFRVRVEGGPPTSLAIEVEDPASERWVERALLRSYEPGEWHRIPRRSASGTGARWGGRRRLTGESGRNRPELGQLLRALSRALRFSGRGSTLTVALRPARASRLVDLGRWWPSALPRERLRTPSRPPSLAPGRPAAVEPREPAELPWRAAIDLWLERPAQGGGRELGPAAVRSAWTALDGSELFLRRVPATRGEAFCNLLAGAELLALLPSGEEALDGPVAQAASLGLPVGRTREGAVVSLPLNPGEGRHFAVLGETGMGKSSLLVSVAVRAAALGGLVVLDPLGETAETIRAELAAVGREVLWVAPGAPGVATNALAGIHDALRTDPVRAERELGDLVQALRRVRAGRYVDAPYWGPRLEEMLARAIRAAALVPGGTLEDAHALLARAGTERSVVPPAADAEVRELARMIRDRPEDVEGARRLLFEVVRNPTLRALLCARAPGPSFPERIGPGLAVLVSGAASTVGESTARYLLAAYLALLWSGLLARPPAGKTFVLLDEAQWFAHEGLGEMLRLGRRRDVHVGLATQSLASLAPDLQEAVRTNVADLVVFRGSPEEALELGRAYPSVPASTLLRLGRGEAAVLVGKGEVVRWARTARRPGPTQWPPPNTDRGTLGPDGAGELATPLPPVEGFPDFAAAPVPGVATPEADGLASVEVPAHGGPSPSTGELWEVDLGSLRARGLVSERELRALGGELGRCGAIARSGRGPSGPVWWVAPGALSPTLADRLRGHARAPADSPQRL